MSRRVKTDKNYLDRVPNRPQHFKWTSNDEGIVSLEIENKGVFNTLAQKLLKKPRISYVHLDEIGSFVWSIMDGEKSVADLAADVEERFGEKSNPLYERLVKYMHILDSYGFVEWIEK